MTLQIGLIDTNIMMRLGIQMLLKKHFDASFSEANNMNEFITLHSGELVSLIIIGMNGRDSSDTVVIRDIQNEFPQVPIVVFDDREQHTIWGNYFRLEINGYLSTQQLYEELPKCVQEVTIGNKFLSSNLLGNLLISLQKPLVKSNNKSKLTTRETEVANLLCQGMRTTGIAQSLDRKPSTISTIKNNIMKKLNARNVLELSRAFEENF